MLRWFVAIFPLAGAILLPLIVSITISSVGLSAGVLTALIFSSIWFVFMLRTSEMPH